MTDPVRKALYPSKLVEAGWGLACYDDTDSEFVSVPVSRLRALRAALDEPVPEPKCKSCGQPKDHYSHTIRYSMPAADNNHLGSHLYQPAPETPTEPRGYPPGPLIDPETPTERRPVEEIATEICSDIFVLSIGACPTLRDAGRDDVANALGSCVVGLKRAVADALRTERGRE